MTCFGEEPNCFLATQSRPGMQSKYYIIIAAHLPLFTFYIALNQFHFIYLQHKSDSCRKVVTLRQFFHSCEILVL